MACGCSLQVEEGIKLNSQGVDIGLNANDPIKSKWHAIGEEEVPWSAHKVVLGTPNQ